MGDEDYSITEEEKNIQLTHPDATTTYHEKGRMITVSWQQRQQQLHLLETKENGIQ